MRQRLSILLAAGLCTPIWIGLVGWSEAPAAAQVQAEAPPQPPAVQEFQKLEDKWSVALANKDQYALENLLAPTYIDISAGATVTTRNQSIADTLAGLPQPLLSVEQKVVNVRLVGDVAVIEGTYMLRLKEGQRTRDERGIFTHIYQRAHNQWSCVNGQRTAVVDQLEGSRGRAATRAGAANGTAPDTATGQADAKKSNAALPFHIPLIYKGSDSKTPQQTPPVPSNPPQ